jgi:hypothetical protein
MKVHESHWTLKDVPPERNLRLIDNDPSTRTASTSELIGWQYLTSRHGCCNGMLSGRPGGGDQLTINGLSHKVPN